MKEAGFGPERFSLAGKRAIVTGGAKQSGICCTMAQALNACGARVVILDADNRLEQTVAALGGAGAGYSGIVVDITDDEALEAGFQTALDHLGGGVDILVNGAGFQYRSPALEFPPEQWDKVLAINLTALFRLSQMAAAKMVEQGSGRIINICSTTSFIGLRNMPAYVSSKGAVKQLTMALSTEWSALGVNVNAIAPGYIETEMSRDLQASPQGAELTKRIPKGRWGRPEDLAGACVFLASPAAEYVTGVILQVDGGHLSS